MTRRLAAVFAAALAVAAFGIADAARACSCVRFRTAAEQLERSDAVFRARVVASERLGPSRAVTTFEVVEGLKGGVAGRVRVGHGTETGGACGVVFKPGAVVELTARRGEDGGWSTSSCAMPQHPWAEFRAAAGR